MMDDRYAAYLAECNCMGRKGNSRWLPYRKTDEGAFLTPDGLRAVPPSEVRMMDPKEIVAEMDAMGVVPFIMRPPQ